jgi:crotonobetainyl-CoA:carnitine CoA-transferase CaiB-like acyl-CoA transferase
VKAYLIKLEDNVWSEHCKKCGELDDQDDDARNPQRLARQGMQMKTKGETKMKWLAKDRDHLYSSLAAIDAWCEDP